MTRRRTLGVLAVAVLVLLAGCSGAVSDGPTATDQQTSATTEATNTTTTTTETPNGTLSVHFINVGQGSSILVVGPENETILIDTGDWTDDGEIVLNYLQRQGVERLDYLVTSHADADHIGGHEAVINYFETQGEGVGAAYDPGIASSSQTYQEYLDAVDGHDVPLFQTRASDEIPLANASVDVLAPPQDRLADGDRNENSVVLRMAFGQSTFLLPGDGEAASERYLTEAYGAGLNATVLSAGHHGSQSSSSAQFLDVTDPRVAVISSAYDSQYGHPHEDVLQRFADRSIRTYWTATHGNVVLTSNGSAVTVATQRDAPTAPLELRDGDSLNPGTSDDVEVRTVVPASGTGLPPDGGTTTEPTTSTTTAESTTTKTGDAGSLAVVGVHADATGSDRENLNDEYVVFENTGSETLDLEGWTVSDAADHAYVFPSDVTLDPGEQVTLHTGSGDDSASDLYWGSGSPVWNNAGDTIIVETNTGTVVVEETY
ncbi:beta-lactamase domain protein [Halobacterium hubeiense]|uniref:Beta-lactamase domain protein n=1 Tax=Halobacterium hubeiense TaxID=1407499 RepID=A0A0U5GZZ2_9EURY|nr:lamin tail domain-containing protein [Halobacterium hubeiense]CQH55307.1 beta-lactamase domain protein [Halobacterium hubeiense]